MNNLVKTNNSIAQTQKQPKFSVFMSQDNIKNLVQQAVGKNAQRFTTSIISAVSTNQELQQCTQQTILSCALLGESLNLNPSPQLGQYYMIPFKKKGKNGESDTSVATFVLGYKGYIQLAIRSGFYKKINALAIKSGELIRYDALNEEIEVNLIEDEEVRENTPTIGYYAMFEYSNGFKKVIYWSKKKMLSHADKYSPAFSAKGTTGKFAKVSFEDFEKGKVSENDMWLYSSHWYKDFDGMALKTLIRQLISKWGIMSIDMQKAFESDSCEIKENGEASFVDLEENQEVKIEVKEEKVETKNEKIVVEPNEEDFDFFNETN